MYLISIYLLTFVSIVSANIFYDLSKEDYNEVKNSRNFTGKVVWSPVVVLALGRDYQTVLAIGSTGSGHRT